MMKTISYLLLSVIILVSTKNFAQTCPTVEEVRNQKISGWKFIDSDDGKVLTSKRAKEFTKLVEKFVLAEWDDKKNEIHCYYSDKHGTGFDTYIAKSANQPVASKHWYQVTGASHCVAGMEKCTFSPQYLAKR